VPVFHEGEQALQREAGSLARLAEIGPRVMRDHMPEQHREFFPLLPFLLVGSVDATGQPWASVLTGPPGFAHSPRPDLLRVDAMPPHDDPLHPALRNGARVGLLGIQPHTRRRNRLNGTIAARDESGFAVHVDQSFGNCPKYIQPREPLFAPELAAGGEPARTMAALDAQASRIVGQADTFFIATAHPRSGSDEDAAHGVDVSHRGGPAGFVAMDAGGGVLTVPDYVGNSYFNTLGNLLLQPRCGLAFLAFGTGELLQVSARAEIVRDPAQVAAWPGAQRLLRLAVTGARLTRGALPLQWR
jgi:predicted pyridoxine 5'-phosphate oxidase superfamily flavin-nucleotide-binding protein